MSEETCIVYRIHALKLMPCVIVEIPFAENISAVRHSLEKCLICIVLQLHELGKCRIGSKTSRTVISSQPRKLARVFSGSVEALILCAAVQM